MKNKALCVPEITSQTAQLISPFYQYRAISMIYILYRHFKLAVALYINFRLVRNCFRTYLAFCYKSNGIGVGFLKQHIVIAKIKIAQCNDLIGHTKATKRGTSNVCPSIIQANTFADPLVCFSEAIQLGKKIPGPHCLNGRLESLIRGQDFLLEVQSTFNFFAKFKYKQTGDELYFKDKPNHIFRSSAGRGLIPGKAYLAIIRPHMIVESANKDWPEL